MLYLTFLPLTQLTCLTGLVSRHTWMVAPDYFLLRSHLSHFCHSFQFVKDTSAKVPLILGIKVLLYSLIIHFL